MELHTNLDNDFWKRANTELRTEQLIHKILEKMCVDVGDEDITCCLCSKKSATQTKFIQHLNEHTVIERLQLLDKIECMEEEEIEQGYTCLK